MKKNRPGLIPGKEMVTSPLLEQRRTKYGIPRLPYFLAWDRVALYQLDTTDNSDTFKGTSLVKAETTKNRERRTSPRGVICGMGMGAYDQLRGQGIELGHIVWFQKLSVWQHEFDQGGGKHAGFALITAGEVTGSEDVATSITKGKVHFEFDQDGRLCISDPDKPRGRPDRPNTHDL